MKSRGLFRTSSINLLTAVMNKKIIIGILSITALILISFIFYSRQPTNKELDSFAKCLSEKGVAMYGTDWCSHCQNEKKSFGQSFRFINYIDCQKNPQKCVDAGVNGLPTWIFEDGRKLEGEQGIEKLAEESGCPLPQPTQK